jgi:DNA gyrase/topoisomerase IV subunit A
MLDKKDVQWWVQEAQKHPESAVNLIRLLAERLAFLDKQNEELRGELITLRREQRGESANAETHALQQRIQELETALRQGQIGRRLLIYGRDRIEANLLLNDTQVCVLDHEPTSDVRLLLCYPMSQLLIVTAESQVFAVPLEELPAPQDGPALLGNPSNVVAILDQSAFERCRFLTLVSQGGYVYSVLAGTVSQATRRQDKLIRKLIPGDPIVAAVPSYNADLFGVSQKTRWTRFPERAVAGSGSLVMDLPKGDALANMIPLSQETDLAFLSADGKLFIRPSGDFKARRTPGASSGMALKGQTLMGVASGDELAVLTQRGKLLIVRLADLPYQARTEAGTPLPGLEADDSVLVFASN